MRPRDYKLPDVSKKRCRFPDSDCSKTHREGLFQRPESGLTVSWTEHHSHACRIARPRCARQRTDRPRTSLLKTKPPPNVAAAFDIHRRAGPNACSVSGRENTSKKRLLRLSLHTNLGLQTCPDYGRNRGATLYLLFQTRSGIVRWRMSTHAQNNA
jgi:hypothetical protein